MSYWSIAVDAPLPQALTYLKAAPFENLERGMLVQVPLGNRKARGVILKSTSEKPDFDIKPILSVEQEYPVLDTHFMDWLEWVANYYQYPVGQVMQLAYPPLNKKESTRRSKRDPVVKSFELTQAPQLTIEQQACIQGIQEHPGFSTHLIFGVTGSGKTEVYLQLLEKLLSEGKSALVLVPEISLTPQLINRFSKRFGDRVAALHSQLTDRERTNQWWSMITGEKKILIGARSALFCPIKNLGMIIIDEEHEPSFKQEEKLKYNARDSAIMLAKFSDCPVVLGSATPSLETWKNTLDKKYHLHVMKERVENRSMPEVSVVCLKQQEEANSKISGLPFWLSPDLYEKIATTLDKKEQVALFLNRRGVAHMVLCPACGFVKECPNCDISLTLHAHSHLVCHYCDYHENFKVKCPDCAEGELTAIGLGTELVEQEMARLFPKARIARADRDEIQSRQSLEELIHKMEVGEIDILIGTQMIAKGLDFPKLTLVGLLLADIGFNLPDFRASERSFQLITQVSGRAGRHVKPGDSPGQVVIQTYNPEHTSVQFARNADYVGFADHELQARAELNYPPYGKIVSFRIQGNHLGKVTQCAQTLAERAHSLKRQQEVFKDVEVLGPAEAAIAKLRGQFRFHLLVKGPTAKTLNVFSQKILGDQEWVESGIRIILDVDPISLI